MKAGGRSGTNNVLARIVSRLKCGISESGGLFYVKLDCCSGKLGYICMLKRRQAGSARVGFIS